MVTLLTSPATSPPEGSEMTTVQNIKLQGGSVVHRSTTARTPFCNPNRSSSSAYGVPDAVTCKRCLKTIAAERAAAVPDRLVDLITTNERVSYPEKGERVHFLSTQGGPLCDPTSAEHPAPCTARPGARADCPECLVLWSDADNARRRFCAHCGIVGKEHGPTVAWRERHPNVCDRPREGLELVGVAPNAVDWVAWVTRSTNGRVTTDGRRWPAPVADQAAEQRDGAEWAAATAEPSRPAVERYRRARADDAEPGAERPRGHMNMTGPDGLRHRVTYTRKPLCDQRQDWAMRPLGGSAGPVNCPPCVLAVQGTEKDAAYWVTVSRGQAGWQEPRDVPEWWPAVEPGALVEITPPPLVPLRIEPVRDAGGSVHGWALGFLMSAVERYLSADVSAEADRLRDKLAHAKKCVETNTIRPMPRRTSDSADEFERGYAKRSGLTVAELRATGRTVQPCHCGEPDCPGWQSVKSAELVVPTAQDRVRALREQRPDLAWDKYEARAGVVHMIGSNAYWFAILAAAEQAACNIEQAISDAESDPNGETR